MAKTRGKGKGKGKGCVRPEPELQTVEVDAGDRFAAVEDDVLRASLIEHPDADVLEGFWGAA